MIKKKWWQRLLPHALAFLIFFLAAFVYCKPAFEHKVLQQEDVTQWKAMSRSSFQFKEKHGVFPLWTESMFSGMPAYLIAMESRAFVPHGPMQDALFRWLPKPAGFFFLACICMYFLALVLRINPYIGIITGLAYAYATYNPVIISVGHETKMEAIALLPAFIGGFIMIYDKRYGWGATLTILNTGMIVGANHMQIFYYGLIIAAGMTIGYTIRWVRQKDWNHLLTALPLAAACFVTGVLCNAVLIFTTYDFSKATIRGGSELGTTVSERTGLSNDYAFSYSLYPSETGILMVPKMYGGSSGPELKPGHSKAIASLERQPAEIGRDIRQQDLLTFYWGGIGGTAGPAYAGAVICFLALIGLFILDNKHKWWIAATALLAILMSWGGYFASFNGLLLRYLPMYNKFRAPSVILVVPVFLLTVLAGLSLQRIWSMDLSRRRFNQGLLLSAALLLTFVIVYFRMDYMTWYDKQFLHRTHASDFVHALADDRKSLFLHSLLRTLAFFAATALTATLYIKGKIKDWLLLPVIGALAFIDIIGIDLQYLDHDSYKPAAARTGDQTATAADRLVLQDSGYYRVFDLRYGAGYTLTYGAATAWFHRTIGGYNAAKLSIYQDLIEHQLSRWPKARPVVNMLNTRYFIMADDSVVRNDNACGPAWLVQHVSYAPTANAVMEALSSLDTKDSAVLFEADSALIPNTPSLPAPPGAPATSGSITLISNDNDSLTYTSSTESQRFAVFSEIFYDRGWKAYIDGVETPIFRTNYVLRGLSIPPGRHIIRFIFRPPSFYRGQQVQKLVGIITLLLLILMIYTELKKLSQAKMA